MTRTSADLTAEITSLLPALAPCRFPWLTPGIGPNSGPYSTWPFPLGDDVPGRGFPGPSARCTCISHHMVTVTVRLTWDSFRRKGEIPSRAGRHVWIPMASPAARSTRTRPPLTYPWIWTDRCNASGEATAHGYAPACGVPEVCVPGELRQWPRSPVRLRRLLTRWLGFRGQLDALCCVA
jgi:hypothetical protein